eukprot:3644169-Pleurochrysis_carterae.AAC.1
MIHVNERLGLSTIQIQKEAENLSRLKHPHLVRYFHSCTFNEGKTVAIVMELLDGGSLTSEMLKAPSEHKIATW